MASTSMSLSGDDTNDIASLPFFGGGLPLDKNCECELRLWYKNNCEKQDVMEDHQERDAENERPRRANHEERGMPRRAVQRAMQSNAPERAMPRAVQTNGRAVGTGAGNATSPHYRLCANPCPPTMSPRRDKPTKQLHTPRPSPTSEDQAVTPYICQTPSPQEQSNFSELWVQDHFSQKSPTNR